MFHWVLFCGLLFVELPNFLRLWVCLIVVFVWGFVFTSCLGCLVCVLGFRVGFHDCGLCSGLCDCVLLDELLL